MAGWGRQRRDTVHPPLCPAFRVRRGERATGVDTTRHDGSRASGYPPDFVSFRRRAGALFAGAARRHRSLGRSRPPSLWAALFGNATKSAGCANRGEVFHKAQTSPNGQQRRRARPYDTLRPRSGCSHRTGAETVARWWAIERNEFVGLTRPQFYLVVFNPIIRARRATRGRALPRRARLRRRCRLNPFGRRSLARFSTFR